MILSSMQYLEKLSKDMVKRLRKKWTDVPIQDLEDTVQDALVRYLEKTGSLDSISPQWMMTTCTHILIDKHRRSGVVVSLPDVDEVLAPDSSVLIDISLDSCQPEVKKMARSLAFPEE